MPVITRKQHFETAQMVPLQAGKRIRSPADLEDLVATFALNHQLGAFVDTLDVSLQSAFPLATLRQSFFHLPNLTDLMLIITGVRRSIAPLRNYFRTNLRHHALADFLSIHMSITDLDMLCHTHCPRSVCPLRRVDLSNLLCLSGPAHCVYQLTCPNLTRLTMTLNDASRSVGPLLRSMPAPLPLLYQLTLDIRDDDHDVLNSIAFTCPALRKLKLLEQTPRSGLSWSKALRRLPELEELLLCTGAPLVRKKADLSLERQAILTWIYGTRRVASISATKAHPVLYHVGVWYGAGKYGGGCVTHWSKPSGVWERTISILEPSADYVFI
ncbi:hypothetical protein PYCCODRAFT_1446810 [Trametes coccinea BRFM310]|uniref:F-box domain-containing protein n=1 Tax=Trametes coccinea (strain BRFM310) TaxID=1353009 RepID=A0A1Y2IDY2_TRAC3|nr:hypothetical protein PYCCODRAFT_1446810 [Trametes coccinea BRFM310]